MADKELKNNVGIDKTCTNIYDYLSDKMEKVASSTKSMNELKSFIKFISDKNSGVLQTNIVGDPILINAAEQAKLFSILGISKDEFLTVIKSSPRLSAGNGNSGINMFTDQFMFAAPLLILAGKLNNKNKKADAQGIMVFAYYKAYSSNVSRFFKYGVDEAAMAYTLNMVLDNRSYIVREGSVYATLVASAKTTYISYIDILGAKKGKPTDDMLFNNICYSSIFSKTKSWLYGLCASYMKVKEEGSHLNYEKSYFGSENDDTGKDIGIGRVQTKCRRDLSGSAVKKYDQKTGEDHGKRIETAHPAYHDCRKASSGGECGG